MLFRSLSVHEYAAKEIKLAVVGKGSADKVQVQHMIGVMATSKAYLHLGLPAPRRPDVADLFGG